MTKAWRVGSALGVGLVAAGVVAGLAYLFWQQQDHGSAAFHDAARQGADWKLLEGLPHLGFEHDVWEQEWQTKSILELDGYPFYSEPLTIAEADIERLRGILSAAKTYRPHRGEGKCGGFHPDYAAEWRVGEDRYRVLICFGCGEVKLFGPNSEARYDLDEGAYKALRDLLKHYHKNRPASAVRDRDGLGY